MSDQNCKVLRTLYNFSFELGPEIELEHFMTFSILVLWIANLTIGTDLNSGSNATWQECPLQFEANHKLGNILAHKNPTRAHFTL